MAPHEAAHDRQNRLSRSRFTLSATRRPMRNKFFLILLAIVCTTAGCSSQQGYRGKWKSSLGTTMVFTSDSTVELGQEGYSEVEKARYSTTGDTLKIIGADQVDTLGTHHSEYTFHFSGERLRLLQTALYRGTDFDATTVEKIARSSLKSVEDFSFKREEEK
jgi:hypothetical protein